MPRPTIRRKVCCLPEVNLFGPLISNPSKREIIYMTVEEYESIRIIDFIGKNQEICADEMHVSRATAQRIYYAAKQKIAEALVNGKILKIEGGNYRLCNVDDEEFGKCPHCPYKGSIIQD
ncbi:MAG: DUF134 domain-containing protein [Acholeplasmataceae bacterium]|nr:DUF134 domain-containing protein [Acholeplasmataceae bacterium]